MAFTVTNTTRTVIGDKILVIGQAVNDGGSTGGNIDTGLRRVEFFTMTKNGAAVDASQYAVNETIPSTQGVMTVVTTADVTFSWMAIGTE